MECGSIVEVNGLTGEVVRKGTNYLSFMTEDGKVHKAWLHEIELEERNMQKNTRIITHNQNRLQDVLQGIKLAELWVTRQKLEWM